MSSRLKEVLLQAVTAMAWADGSIDPAQQRILRELYADEQLPAELAEQWLSFPVAFPCGDEVADILPDCSDRLDLITQLLHLALTDGRLDAREAGLMRILGEDFGVDPEILKELEHQAAG